MFKVNVSVPRITQEQVSRLEAESPGIRTVALIPVIETEEVAIKAGSVIARRSCEKREYVRGTESVTQTNTGWDIVYIISGD